jgi:hypothetical protein
MAASCILLSVESLEIAKTLRLTLFFFIRTIILRNKAVVSLVRNDAMNLGEKSRRHLWGIEG